MKTMLKVLKVKPRACTRGDKRDICTHVAYARVYARTLNIINTLNKKRESISYDQ